MKVRGSKERKLRKSCKLFFSYGGRLQSAIDKYKKLYPRIKARRVAQIATETHVNGLAAAVTWADELSEGWKDVH